MTIDQENGNDVTWISGGKIGFPCIVPNDFWKGLNRLVSSKVTFLSIEVWKPVDPDKGQRASMAISFAPANLLWEVTVEKSMIVEPGQAIYNRSLDLLLIQGDQIFPALFSNTRAYE